MVADLGEAAVLRFIDFFSTNIRNQNTGAAGRHSGGSAGHALGRAHRAPIAPLV
jgi:hypothetical protein